MNKSMKIISLGRLITFIVTALTAIPLLLNHIKGVRPEHRLITDLHTWFGVAFIILAVISMSQQRKNRKKQIHHQESV